MTNDYNKYLIKCHSSILDALKQLNSLKTASALTLYAYDNSEKVVGSLTDGDIRRALIKGVSLEESIEKAMNVNFYFINGHKIDPDVIKTIRQRMETLPVLTDEGRLKGIINFATVKNILPVHAVVMAGGRGERLRPMTDLIPKPLLEIGGKPIIKHTYDRLKHYGIDDITISVNYLGNKIIDYFNSFDKNISYVKEDQPLGTVGSLTLIDNIKSDYILLTNSDLFTNIDLESFYFNFIEHKADMIVASIPYTMNIPYAIFEGNENTISAFKEKPIINNYANAGVYLFKKELLELIPRNQFFNATDLMQKVIDKGMKIIHNPIMGYWIDIGKIEDFNKANELCMYM